MTKKQITELYRSWRKQYKNHRPDRAVVRMYWEDGDNTEKGYQEDIVALKHSDIINLPPDDNEILFYAGNLKGLLQLTEPNNGSDFVITDVIQFYRYAD
jgi:hypothetical protein